MTVEVVWCAGEDTLEVCIGRIHVVGETSSRWAVAERSYCQGSTREDKKLAV